MTGNINIEEFELLLKNFENHNIEFRADLAPQNNLEEKHRAAKTIVAFLNTNGGKIIFGINNIREVIGLDNPQTTESNITTQIRAKCHSDANLSFQFFNYKNKDVLIVNCPRGEKPPYKFDNVVLVRRGSNNVEATEDEIANMYRNRDVSGCDNSLVKNAGINDINLEEAFAYIEGLQIIGEEREKENNYRLMCNMGLLKPINNEYIPTVAGILLFGKNPQMFFPNAVVKADLKYNDDEEWSEISEIKGTIIEQIEECERFFMRHIPKSAKIIGFKRIDEYQIPIAVFREAVVNAVVHRNYLDSSGAIHIHLKKDEIIIMSPGGLLPPLTIDIILKGFFEPRTRNPIIALEVLRKGYMERRGNGLVLIRKSLEKLNLTSPKFEDKADSFIITIYLPSKKENFDKVIIPDNVWKDIKVDKDIEKVLQLIEKNGKAQLQDFENLLHKTRGAFIKKIDYLLDKKIIERFPPKPKKSPKTYYTIHNIYKSNTPLSKELSDDKQDLQGTLFQ